MLVEFSYLVHVRIATVGKRSYFYVLMLVEFSYLVHV